MIATFLQNVQIISSALYGIIQESKWPRQSRNRKDHGSKLLHTIQDPTYNYAQNDKIVTRERRALGEKRTRQSKRFEYTANKRLIIRDSFLYDRPCTVASLLEFDTCDSLDISQY